VFLNPPWKRWNSGLIFDWEIS